MSATKTYLVWSPDIESREDAGQYDAPNAEFAAEGYMEDNFDGAAEYFLMVEDSDGAQYEVDIEVEYVPTFFPIARKL